MRSSTRRLQSISNIYESVIGLEVHAQINSETKLFSRSPSIFAMPNAPPNSIVSYFDASLPGTLPELGKQSVQQALRAAIALNCKVNNCSMFERKHYFYQDLPLGYQITQQKKPIASDGYISVDVDNCKGNSLEVKIQRIQLEQDSGRSIHDVHPNFSLVDLNRAGSALIEIVFGPCLRNAAEAAATIKTLQQLLRHIGVCDGNMETGSLRCDVNISLRKIKHDTNEIQEYGNRVEIKNVSSIQRVVQAIEYEIKRQTDLLEQNELSSLEDKGRIRKETRGFDPDKGITFHLRDKETALDYRFFPDPDLPLLFISDEEIEEIRATMPELPKETIKRLKSVYHLDDLQIQLLLSSHGVQYYETVMQLFEVRTRSGTSETSSVLDSDRISVYNWISTELLGLLNVLNLDFRQSPVTESQMSKCMMLLLIDKSISGPQCKQLLRILFEEEIGSDPEAVIVKKGWKQITDSSEVANICLQVVEDPANVEPLRKFLAGKKNMDKFFFGEVMKKSKGQASPQVVNSTLKDILQQKLNQKK